jgi:hypothetical protein
LVCKKPAYSSIKMTCTPLWQPVGLIFAPEGTASCTKSARNWDGRLSLAKSVQLSAVVQDEKGLQQLDIFVNDHKVNPSGGRAIRIADGSYPHRLEIEQRIGLFKGANIIKIHAIDTDGLEKYLLPYEANPNGLYASALPMREVAYIFHRIRSERLVFVADAWYSGASGGRTVSVSGVRANMSDRFLERLASGKGKVIITASSANEVSVEKDELGHGVFTYYLMEGLRGSADTDADGLVTVDEAYRYVSEKVPAATGQEQHPHCPRLLVADPQDTRSLKIKVTVSQ